MVFEGRYGYIGAERVADAEEYFQARRDAELGRWRSPRHPDYVVYLIGYEALVIGEHVGLSQRFERGMVDASSSRVTEQVAAAYFEAHPEPKPWHSASKDDFWLVTHMDASETCRVDDVNGVLRFVGVESWGTSVSMPVTHPSITDAVRLVLEVSS